MNPKLSVPFLLLAATACASSPKDISPAYISSTQYRDYDCEQISSEMQRLSRRVSDLGGTLQNNADNDAAVMGVGLILFWPSLFFLNGDSHQTQEYARLQGEFQALEEAAIQKKCTIRIEHPVIEPKEPEKKENPGYPNA